MKKYIVNFSGGKDSTCMLLKMLEKGMQVDDIIFCDTGMEFPQMYDHIKQVEKYVGRPITILKAGKSFEYFLFEKQINRGKHAGEKGYGFPRVKRNRWCTSELKINIVEKYFKEKYSECEIVQYIGIASDELKRVKDKKYPLVEWNITEKDALEYCYSKGFGWGGLYKIFKRVSCWCCPMQTLKELKKLKDNFPDLYGQLKEWELKTYNNFRPDYSLPELDIKFSIEDEAIKNGINPKSKTIRDSVKEAIKISHGLEVTGNLI